MMLELNKIYNMDCLEGMKQMEDSSVDCVIIKDRLKQEVLQFDSFY